MRLLDIVNNKRTLLLYIVCITISGCVTESLKTATIAGQWGEWGEWTVCNRPCGLGVRNRTRRCLASTTFQSSRVPVKFQCEGDKIQYSTCNTNPCPTSTPDFRAEQCSDFDQKKFHGKDYKWKPYLTSNGCQLTCKANGRSFYVKLAEKVKDGTRCSNDDNSVCIDGQCKAIGCDNVLGSKTKLDKCGVCGGRSDTCKIISGLYKKTDLPYGYNNITILPRGACNINITELRYSRNYLALKVISKNKFIFNSNWHINYNGEFKAAGTIFKYMRPTNRYKPYKEHVLAKGPLSEAVAVLILYQQTNPGIFYSYTLGKGASGSSLATSPEHSTIETSYDGKNQPEKPENRLIMPDREDQYRTSVHKPEENDDKGFNRPPIEPPKSIRDEPWNRQARDRYGAIEPWNRVAGRRTYASRGSTSSSAQYATNPRSGTGTRLNRGRGGRLSQSADRLYQTSAQVVRQGNGQHTRTPEVSRTPQHTGSRSQSSYNSYGGTQQQQRQESRYYTGTGASSSASSGTGARTGTAASSGSTSGRRASSDSSAQSRTYWNPEFTPGDSQARDRYGTPYAPMYEWRVSGFTECTKSCGGGIQSSRVICIVHSSLAVVTDENCNPSTKPTTRSLACNTNPCPAKWYSGVWSACSVTCGFGHRRRMVECRASSRNLQVAVSATRCLAEPKPATIESCEMSPCHRWKIGKWSQCDVQCGRGQQKRDVYCVDKNDRKLRDNECEGLKRKPIDARKCQKEACHTGWMYSEWADQCSADCRGQYSRNVLCAARNGCNQTSKPQNSRMCREEQGVEKKCGGQWLTGPWSTCSESCKDSSRSRTVVCTTASDNARAVSVLREDSCDVQSKPESTEACAETSCTAQWYMTDWSQCSATCGEAYRSRVVQCLTKEQHVAKTCDMNKRPPSKRPCDHVACPTPPPLDPSCRDLLASCKMVVRARLCSYKYYTQRCCHSCTRYDATKRRYRRKHRKRHVQQLT